MNEVTNRELVEKTEQALGQGKSQRQVAKQLGISLATVNRIANGKRILEEDQLEEIRRQRRARRCPGCGGKIYAWPCLKCHVDQQKEKERQSKRNRPTHL